MLDPGRVTTAPSDPAAPAPLLPASVPRRPTRSPTRRTRAPTPPPPAPSLNHTAQIPPTKRRRTLDPQLAPPSPFNLSLAGPFAATAAHAAAALDLDHDLVPVTDADIDRVFAAPHAAIEQPHSVGPAPPPRALDEAGVAHGNMSLGEVVQEGVEHGDSGGNGEAHDEQDAADELERVKNGAYGYHLQDVPCCTARASHPLKPLLAPALKCQACTSKYTGFTCAFVGLRSFPLDREGKPTPFPAFVDAGEDEDERPVFPLLAPSAASSTTATFTGATSTSTSTASPPAFNVPFTPSHAHALRLAAATHLPSHLALELAHAARPDCARVARRALATRTTCDGCNAAVLSGSWICGTCGREYCLACGEALGALDPAAGTGSGARDEGDRAREDKLTRCKAARVGAARHTRTDLVPLARIGADELRRVKGAMERWVVEHGAEAVEGEGEGGEQARRAWDEWVERHRVTSEGEREAEQGRAFVRLGAGRVPPRLDEGWHRAAVGRGEEDKEDDEPPPGGMSQEALFRRLWARGEPMLVDLEVLERRTPSSTASTSASTAAAAAASPRRDPPPPSSAAGPPTKPGLPSLPWSPAFLAAAYGDRPCTVGSNTRDDERQTTVGRFFGGFGSAGRRLGKGGRAGDGEGVEGAGAGREGGRDAGGEEGVGARKVEVRFESEKIKDWPAARDFREYPELWHDFMDVLPAGSITRRDGALNISAHVPVNANPPDLGPKGYFSEISDDGEGGNGSTKLHTVNILMWASDMPDRSPGVAVWDLYAAEDADKLRDFLYGHIAKLEGWKDADEARRRVDDPIHTQRIFLSSPLRAALLASHGVRSFRILQRPNEAVFIPAGCAHQVCNLADCIKVATDFVSVENVARCWKLSDEFHAQTKSKSLWCPDVLELKSMLLWAWYSAERLEVQDAQPEEQQGSTSGAIGEEGTSGDAQDAAGSGEEA
ncbi:hypothetical protein JCM8208_006820 [Rhodotorula glutinis]